MAKAGNVYRTAFALYERRQQIGAGGCGVVYEVANEDGELFALKILHPGIDRKKLKRFKNEIAFCRKTDHPNIVQVLDHGVFDADQGPSPFYVMPLYPETLRGLMGQGISPDDVLRLFGQILSGAEAAHLLGSVHRDLKPENVLFDRESGRLVLADFGIASFQDEDLLTAVETQNGDRLANFKYAAPEQKERGQKATERTDIFALGLILNEMFTHAVPSGANYRKIADVSANHGYLDAVVESMIDQDPSKRPESVACIKLDLKARGNEFISLQKASRLKAEVIPEEEIDDPLVRDPIRIVDFDYGGGGLHFQLSQAPNSDWIDIFHNGGWSHSSLLGHGPGKFGFNGTTMSVRSPAESQIQRVVDHAKSYVAAVNEIYRGRAERDAQKRRQQLVRKRADEIAEAERRQRILKNARL